MKIALVGVSGRVGSRLLAELLKRGHAVTGIARKPADIPPQPRLTVKAADATDAAQLAALLV